MAKYDGLIIPRSYNDYINKSDPLGVSQALQLTGVMDDTPTAGSSKPVKSSGLVGLTSVPVGIYLPFGGTNIPEGWLLCNGQAVSRATYADLFAVIGTAYGNGDGLTTFNVPDLREAVPKGAGLTGKSNNHLDADGLAVGEFLDDRIQEHVHGTPFSSPQGGGIAGWVTQQSNINALQDTYTTKNVRAGATTEVKSVGSNYIIKY